MKKNIDFPQSGDIFFKKIKIERNYEFIERKGVGHPDTLADELAEKISIVYSKYCLNNFGFILHHNFDKVGILGGASLVKFGQGYLTKPIRVLINGRVSTSFGKQKIPYKNLIENTTRDFLKEKFPMASLPMVMTPELLMNLKFSLMCIVRQWTQRILINMGL